MNKNLFLGMLLLMTFSLSLSAQYQQRGFCGTDNMALIPGLLHNKEAIKNGLITSRDDVTYIPITWHLIGRNDGSGKASIADVLDLMCSLNRDFEVANFHFYIKKINLGINSTSVYNDPFQAFNGIFNFQQDPEAINIFIPKSADNDPNDGQNTLGAYYGSKDWLMMGQTEVNGTSATIAHEIGHFFNLPHPHLGWDSENYDEAVHGNPAPAFSPAATPTELQDGSNCETAGDLICDTPPDYNFGFGWNNCNYNRGTMDPNGDIVDPMEINFMGYFLNCPRDEYTFTPMQIEIMQADYMDNSPQTVHSNGRAYLHTNHVPTTTPIDQAPVLISPLNDDPVPGATGVELQWEDVPGATRYLVEISRVASFAIDPIEVIAWGSSYSPVEYDFEENKRYHWRVTPWSNGYFCGPSSTTGSFTTGVGVSTKNPEFVKSWTVFPNPVGADAKLTVNIHSDESFEAQFSLYNITGQLIKSFGKQDIQLGDNNIELAIDGFNNGVYTLAVRSEEGLLKKRIVVSK